MLPLVVVRLLPEFVRAVSESRVIPRALIVRPERLVRSNRVKAGFVVLNVNAVGVVMVRLFAETKEPALPGLKPPLNRKVTVGATTLLFMVKVPAVTFSELLRLRF